MVSCYNVTVSCVLYNMFCVLSLAFRYFPCFVEEEHVVCIDFWSAQISWHNFNMWFVTFLLSTNNFHKKQLDSAVFVAGSACMLFFALMKKIHARG